MSYNLDAVLASTHARIEKKFQDQLSTKTPTFLKFTSEGQALVEGGKELKYPVILANGNAGSYYGDDVLTVSRPGGLQPLTFDWKQFYSTVTIDGVEEIMNAGEAEGASLLEGRMSQAELTTAEKFEEMLFGDGTGNVGGDGSARDWNGLQNLVPDANTTGTIGGLSLATYTKLRSQVVSTAVTAFNTSQAGRSAMTNLWLACKHGSRTPNFAPTTDAIWALYQLSLTANEKYEMTNGDKKMASAGFPSIQFMGNTTVVSSSFCPANHLYMLRVAKPKTDGGIFLVVSKSRNFKMGKFIEPIDQDKRVAKILTAGQLGTDAPYLNGVCTNITG
jgi:hypothetical protein